MVNESDNQDASEEEDVALVEADMGYFLDYFCEGAIKSLAAATDYLERASEDYVANNGVFSEDIMNAAMKEDVFDHMRSSGYALSVIEPFREIIIHETRDEAKRFDFDTIDEAAEKMDEIHERADKVVPLVGRVYSALDRFNEAYSRLNDAICAADGERKASEDLRVADEILREDAFCERMSDAHPLLVLAEIAPHVAENVAKTLELAVGEVLRERTAAEKEKEATDRIYS